MVCDYVRNKACTNCMQNFDLASVCACGCDRGCDPRPELEKCQFKLQ